MNDIATDMAKVISPSALRLERVLPGPIERVWAYLVEPEKRAQWFAGGPMELKPGGAMELFFKHSNLTDEPAPDAYHEAATGLKSPGKITRCEPPHVLGFSWGQGEDASEVLFELRASGDDVLLTLTHFRLRNRGQMVNFGPGWHLHLMMLEDLLRARARRPFWATHAELKKQYETELR